MNKRFTITAVILVLCLSIMATAFARFGGEAKVSGSAELHGSINVYFIHDVENKILYTLEGSSLGSSSKAKITSITSEDPFTTVNVSIEKLKKGETFSFRLHVYNGGNVVAHINPNFDGHGNSLAYSWANDADRNHFAVTAEAPNSTIAPGDGSDILIHVTALRDNYIGGYQSGDITISFQYEQATVETHPTPKHSDTFGH